MKIKKANKKPLHLSALRAAYPKAFKAYVEVLIEDCQDTFDVFPGGKLVAHTELGGSDLMFLNDKKRSDGMTWVEKETTDADKFYEACKTALEDYQAQDVKLTKRLIRDTVRSIGLSWDVSLVWMVDTQANLMHECGL